MDRVFSLLLLVGGGVLVYYGLGASQGFKSGVSKFFTGAPTDKARWMLVGGVVLGLVGLIGVLMPSHVIA